MADERTNDCLAIHNGIQFGQKQSLTMSVPNTDCTHHGPMEEINPMKIRKGNDFILKKF